jgi:hypothetical protein
MSARPQLEDLLARGLVIRLGEEPNSPAAAVVGAAAAAAAAAAGRAGAAGAAGEWADAADGGSSSSGGSSTKDDTASAVFRSDPDGGEYDSSLHPRETAELAAVLGRTLRIRLSPATSHAHILSRPCHELSGILRRGQQHLPGPFPATSSTRILILGLFRQAASDDVASNLLCQALVVGCAPGELRTALADRSDSYLPRRFHEMLGCRRIYTVTAGSTAGNTAGGKAGHTAGGRGGNTAGKTAGGTKASDTAGDNTAGGTGGAAAGGELGAVLSLVRVYLLRVVRPFKYRWPLHGGQGESLVPPYTRGSVSLSPSLDSSSALILIPRLLSSMASYDVASDICRALARGTR